MFKFRYYCVLLRGEWRIYYGEESNKYNVYSFLNQFKIRFKSFKSYINAENFIISMLVCRVGCLHIHNIITAVPSSQRVNNELFLKLYYALARDKYYRYVRITFPDVTP